MKSRDYTLLCKGCGEKTGNAAVRHRADLCPDCQAKAGEKLIDDYIAAYMALESGIFRPGDYAQARRALYEVLQ